MIRKSETRSSKDVILHDSSLQRSFSEETTVHFKHIDTGIHLDSSIELEVSNSHPHGDVSFAVEVQKPGASLPSSVLNLVNMIVGVGVISIPSAFKKVGIVLGLFLTVLFAIFGWFGIYLMIKVADRFVAEDLKLNKSKSEREIVVDFKWVSKKINPLSGYINNFFIFIFTFLCLIAYLLVTGDGFPTAVKGIVGNDEEKKAQGWYSVLTNRQFWMGLSWLCALPFCLLRKLDSLRFASFFAFGCRIYLVILLFVLAITEGISDDIRAGPKDVKGFTCLSVFAFGYACHIGYYSVYTETAPQDRERDTNRGGILSMTIGSVLYIVAGISGYLLCGNGTEGNVLNSMNKGGQSVTVARILISVSIVFTLPLLVSPCRVALISCLKKFQYFKYQNKKMQTVTFYVVTIILMLGSLLCLPINSVDTVLGFAGSLASPVCAFVIPGYNYYKVFSKEKPVLSAVAAAYSVLGVVLMVLGVALQIYDIAS